MSDYTKKNLSEVKDSAAEFGVGEIQEARFADGDVDAQDTGFSHHVLKPGKRQGFGHKHDKAEEVYVVIAGSGRIKLDDEVVELERLDAIRIAPQVKRALEAADDGLEYLAFGPKHKGDGDLDQEFWPAD
ncbi:MAG: cupin domain-containing protein [Solirubrobacteraceae bacterium]